MTQEAMLNDVTFLPENETEVSRLLLLQRYLSESMGGPLPLAVSLKNVRDILDVGCGVGGWSYEMAWLYPSRRIVGIDKSPYFIEQAKAQAGLYGGIDNATYVVQDMHTLGDCTTLTPSLFDLIHLRFLVGDVLPHQFAPLLASLTQRCRKGGCIVWSEMEFPLTNSPAFEHFVEMVSNALEIAGRAFVPGRGLGITAMMATLLRNAGLQEVDSSAHAIDVSTGTALHDAFVRQVWIFGHQVRRFLLHNQVTTATVFEDLFAQMQREVRDEAFCGVCFLLTCVGRL